MNSKLAKHLAVVLILIFLFVLVIGKALLTTTPNTFLLIYGTLITSTIFFLFFISAIFYRDPSEEIRKKGIDKDLRKPLISCVLAVKDDEKIISKCVDSLINSDYPNKEIIVVNDASVDGTGRILEKYNLIHGVKIINLEKNLGKKKAIAEGLKIANGEIFVFTDSDSVMAPDAISRVIEIFIHDENVGAISGHGRALNASENFITKIQDPWYETQYSVKKGFESVFGAVTCVSGPLAVFRRSAIYNYIPAWANDTFLGHEFKFATDRQLTSYVLGNRYVGEKLKKKYKDSFFLQNENYPIKDWKVIYCKSAKVWTVVPNTFRKAVRQQVRWKKSFIRNLFSTGKFYWRKPVIPAMRFYLGAAFILIGPFIAIRHLIYLPLQGNFLSPVYYLAGILFVGSLYAMMYSLDNSDSRWVYRPLMNVLSTVLFSWLIFYSIFTIRKMVWHRG